MTFRKSTTPIDRAVADVERQIADLKHQTRQAESPAPRQPARQGLWKEWFAPPPRHMAATTRHAPLDVPVEPLKELEQTPFPFEQQPDLFNPARGGVNPARSGDKFAQYLNAGPMKTRPLLRHVQRQNRHRFYLWLALGIVVLGLLWLVVH